MIASSKAPIFNNCPKIQLSGGTVPLEMLSGDHMEKYGRPVSDM